MNKFIAILGLLLVLCAGVLLGHSFWPQVALAPVAGSSPVGSTFNTAKIAAISFVPLTATATTTSILNTDANDRYITSSFSLCSGVGSSPSVSTLTFTAATTSTNAPASLSSTRYVLNVTIATTTPVATNATSTYGETLFQVWATNSYLTFASNATNTAACTVGVNYVPS